MSNPITLPALLLYLLFLLFIFHHTTAQLHTVQGQSKVNELRHTVAISNLPSSFGKQGSLLLSRSLVAPSRVWHPDVVDFFTRNVLEDPSRLDWYVADVVKDTVSINYAFSCLDLGQSSAVPLTWWVSTEFTELTNLTGGVGSAERSSGGDGSVNDITERCLNGRKPIPGLRLVEHNDQHRALGLTFSIPATDFPKSVVGIDSIFDTLSRSRKEKDRSDEVIYHESGLPIVVGLTFDSGFRVKVPNGTTSGKTNQYKTPITPLAAITKHAGSRLEESRVAAEQSRTNAEMVLLSTLSTGLPLLFAVFLVAHNYASTLVGRSKRLLLMNVYEAVEGDRNGWSLGEKVVLLINIFGVLILAAPLVQAWVEGKIDPRISLEVTTGATVFYAASNTVFSDDDTNEVAGAPFIVTGWISVRKLDNGHILVLSLSLSVIVLFGICIAMRSFKQSSEHLRFRRHEVGGISLSKFLGWARVKFWPRESPAAAIYSVYVSFKRPVSSNGFFTLEPDEREILLLASEYWRRKAKGVHKRQEDESEIMQVREKLYEKLPDMHKRTFSFHCRVKMDKAFQVEAMLTNCKPWYNHLPREWEFLRRWARSPQERSMEWYRTNGREPEDKLLIPARLGLLRYMKYINKIEISKLIDTEKCGLERDGVRTEIRLSPIGGGEFRRELGDDDEKVILVGEGQDEGFNAHMPSMSADFRQVDLDDLGVVAGVVCYPERNLNVVYTHAV